MAFGRRGGAVARRPKVSHLLGEGARSVSFEFFPPKDDDAEDALWGALFRLEDLDPSFVSITYGAGGSTRDRTVDITASIGRRTSLTTIAHLTCVGSSRNELRDVIDAYAEAGIENVLALRGDPPGGPGSPWNAHPEGLDHAVQLVELLRESGDFCVGVAAFPDGHPESPSLEFDARVLADKQRAGAEFAITQFFFRADDWFRLRDRAAAAGCDMPIVPGIMPVTNLKQIERFSALSGADFPADLAQRFHALGDDPAAVRALGVEVATQMCAELLDGEAPGLHFYTLNRSSATREVYANLMGRPDLDRH
jgi:methylenetetrahydrofolate reductase (NADPH)